MATEELLLARVLILFHGMPPHAGSPVIGQGLRAYANGQGLASQGHQVFYCTRTEDLPTALSDAASKDNKVKAARGKVPKGKAAREIATEALATLGGPIGSAGRPYSFTETAQLHEVIDKVTPDVILVESPEDMRRLPTGDFSTVLDLYAPRLLEAQYQDGTEERDAVRLFDAISRADYFLFSNERQRHFFLPLLALGGVDCTRAYGDVVPISCPPTMPKRGDRKTKGSTPKDVEFVAGGVFWPWADLSDGLRDLIKILDKEQAGAVRLFGGKYGIRSETTRYLDPRNKLPASERMEFSGIVPIDALWTAYGRASVAFDLMAPGAERSINLSFRQIDYLRCGLPIITSSSQVIAEDLLQYEAGWCVDPNDKAALRSLVLRLLSDPKLIDKASKNAQRLAAEKYAWTHTTAPLHRFVNAPRQVAQSETFLARITREQADLWEDRETNKELRARVARFSSDLDKKSAELAARNRSAEEELADWERERRTLRDASEEAVEFARVEKQAALIERDELKGKTDTLTAQVSLLQADVRKKTQALLKAQHDREALQSEDAVRAQEIWSQAEREITKATRQRDLATEQGTLAQARIEELEAELTASKTSLFKGQAERERIQQETERRIQQVWTQANSEVLKAQSETSDVEDRLVQSKVRTEELEAEVTSSKDDLFESQAQRERLREDSERRVQHVWTQANSEVLKAQSETSDVEDHLVKAQARLSELEDDVRRKTETLMTAERERERVQQEADQHLQEVWRTANAQTLAAQSETQDVRNELVLRLARIEELEGELKAKAEALSTTQQERDSAHRSAAQQVEEIWAEAEQRLSDQEQRFSDGLALAEERATKLLQEAQAAALAKADTIRSEQGNSAAKIEELEYEVSVLNEEVSKKSRELEQAHAQRDAANLEKAALERFVANESASEPGPVATSKEPEVPEA